MPSLYNRLLAALSGNHLQEFAMNSAVDTSELLGGFEQVCVSTSLCVCVWVCVYTHGCGMCMSAGACVCVYTRKHAGVCA